MSNTYRGNKSQKLTFDWKFQRKKQQKALLKFRSGV